MRGNGLRKVFLVISSLALGIFLIESFARGEESCKCGAEQAGAASGESLDKSLKKALPDFDNNPVEQVIFADDKAAAKNCDYVEGRGCKVYPAKKKGALVGFAIPWTGKGLKGPIKILLGITPGGEITGIDVLAQKESPNWGGKITGEDFQKQFLKRTLKNTKWRIEKDGGDIKAVTGASISSRGVANAVKAALDFYEKNKAALLKQGRGS